MVTDHRKIEEWEK
jgi:hypothetical protein